ncbi:armadillo-type protein [Blastocladiella britannica]|nr:armadillo-type protein [Blastocladiella britannica]
MMASQNPNATSTSGRMASYKNRGALKEDDLRRKRGEHQVELRKQKREETLSKRRNLTRLSTDVDDDLDDLLDDPNSEADYLHGQPLALRLQQYTSAVYSDDADSQLKGVEAFRKILSKEINPPIDDVINCGVVRRFVEFLGSANSKLQFEAAWALTNIASGESSACNAVIDAGAVPAFMTLLSSPHPEVLDQAVWALGNIAGEGPRERDLCLNHGYVSFLVSALGEGSQVFQEGSEAMLRNMTWSVNNLCRGRNPPPAWDKVRLTLPAITRVMYTVQDPEAVSDATWALSSLSEGEEDRIQECIDVGAMTALMHALQSFPESKTILQAGVRTLGNVVGGSDLQTQIIINIGALGFMRTVLTSPASTPNARKEVCWALSNITAGTPDQLQSVIDANLIAPLVHQLATGEHKVKKEACWALSNFAAQARNQPAQLRFLVRQGVIKPLCDMLRSKDPRLLLIVLDALEAVLLVGDQDAAVEQRRTGQAVGNQFASFIEECGGADLLYALQDHPDVTVYNRTYTLLERHFDMAEDDEEETEMYGDEAAAAGAFDASGQFSFSGAAVGAGAGFPNAQPAPQQQQDGQFVFQQPSTFGGVGGAGGFTFQ